MYWFSKKKNFIIMLGPALLIYLAYIIIPLFIAVYYSFTNFRGVSAPDLIGFRNYATLFQDKFFLVSVKNTVIVLGISLCILLPASLALGLALNKMMKGINVFKALAFLPNIIAPLIVGLIWGFIFDPEMGLANGILVRLGLENFTQQWIGGLVLTPWCVGVIYLWQNIGYYATLFVAGLKTIPEDIYESAGMDGASKWQTLRYITIPMLKETIAINTVLIVTGCFKVFELVYQLTNGSPNHMSEVLTTYMYNTTFISSKYGYGMSIAVFTCAVTMSITLVYLRILRKKNRAARTVR
ncbi:carbohydrate ABC transporter permease [Luxibacter massiliensis]|uniref:carbohydrate ABC transporter permease n=1 Tax=Luxibacter massiliensis TaxID=2219695 RepID=UPI000F064993|nr:sugar ABC transporter permease [Luxibacter massiliensis]